MEFSADQDFRFFFLGTTTRLSTPFFCFTVLTESATIPSWAVSLDELDPNPGHICVTRLWLEYGAN
jgi:hypothetical protein